jgi:hypothetical protein
MSKPKKWTEIYPYGTKEGDDEAKFFRALARHPKYEYRSTPAIIKSTGLSRQRVEEIVDKYVNKVSPPLIFAHPSNDDHWGYWERCQDQLKDDNRDISKKDKDSRVDKHITGTPSMVDTLHDDQSNVLTNMKLEILDSNPCGIMFRGIMFPVK